MKDFSNIDIRIESDLKEKAEEILNIHGITHEDIINVIYKNLFLENKNMKVDEIYKEAINHSKGEIENMVNEEARNYNKTNLKIIEEYNLLDVSNMTVEEFEDSLIEACKDIENGNYYTPEEARKALGIDG